MNLGTKFALIVFNFIALITIIPLLIMWLWNMVAVDVFDAPAITFWQALLMKILVNALMVGSTTNKNND